MKANTQDNQDTIAAVATAQGDGGVAVIRISGEKSIDIIEKIFEPYVTTKHQSQGTGIGLYITKEIVPAHRGKIQIKDNKPSGTNFIISLPKSD